MVVSVSVKCTLRLFILSLLAAGAAVSAQPAPAPAASVQSPRPNFLIIVADDLGFSDLGAFGSEIDTPHLDALANRGLRFTNLHAAPTCSPTRAMLLTGLDNHEAGLGAMAESLAPNQKGQPHYEGYLRADTATLAEILGKAGYRTLFSGKWHLGLSPEQDPSRRGFASSFAMLKGAHNHFGVGLAPDPAKGDVYRENGTTLTSLPADFYSSDAFASKLIDQLPGAPGEAQPFFAYLAFTAPHFPLHAPPETIAKYKGRYDGGYEALRERRLQRQVELGLLDPKVVPHPLEVAPPWASLSVQDKAVASRKMEIYAAMVDRLDQNVGRVVQALKDKGQYDNTVILFLSDNGAEGLRLSDLGGAVNSTSRYRSADNSLANLGQANSYDSVGPGWAEAASAPSWRFKSFETEGGTRVVSFLSGPGVVPGRVRSFASVVDVVPTFLDLARVARPGGQFEGRPVKPIRGESWARLLAGQVQRVYPADRPVGAELFGSRSLRQGDWKLTDRGDGQWRLFDIARDPGETTDLSAREPRRTIALGKAWDEYARTVGVIIPEPRNPLISR